MSYHRMLAVFLLSFLSSATVAYSQVPCANARSIDHYVESIQQLAPLYDAAEATLMAKPQEEWTQDEVDMMLGYSLAIVYMNYQIEFALNDNDAPSNLEDLPELDHVTTWPKNPFNDWNPTRVMDYPADFSPGNVIVQTYDGMNQESPMTVSFQLYIYGPSLDWPANDLKVMKLNEEWATPPPGAIFSMGMHVETEEERLARQEFVRSLSSQESADESNQESKD